MSYFQPFFKDFLKGFKSFGENLGELINTLILLFIYILGVGLSALLIRLLRKNILDMAPSSKKKTYWVPLNLKQDGMENHYRQF